MKYIKKCEKDYTNDIKNMIALINGDTKKDDLVSIYYDIECDIFGVAYENLNNNASKFIHITTITVTDSISKNSELVNFWVNDFISNQFINKYYIQQYEQLINKKQNYIREEYSRLQVEFSNINHEECALRELKKLNGVV